MSDKFPDTESQQFKQDKVNPTTGEWTARPVKDRAAHAELCCDGKVLAYMLHGDAEAIADAHNAALAAEKQKRSDWIAEYGKQLEKVKQQLAAAVEALQLALVPIAAWKLTDEAEKYENVGPDLRQGLLDAHDSIMAALAKIGWKHE